MNIPTLNVSVNLFPHILGTLPSKKDLGGLALQFASDGNPGLFHEMLEVQQRYTISHTNSMRIAGKCACIGLSIFGTGFFALFVFHSFHSTLAWILTAVVTVICLIFGTVQDKKKACHKSALEEGDISQSDFPEYTTVWKFVQFLNVLQEGFGIGVEGPTICDEGPEAVKQTVTAVIHKKLCLLEKAPGTVSAEDVVRQRKEVEFYLIFFHKVHFIQWDGSFDPSNFAGIEAVGNEEPMVPTVPIEKSGN